MAITVDNEAEFWNTFFDHGGRINMVGLDLEGRIVIGASAGGRSEGSKDRAYSHERPADMSLPALERNNQYANTVTIEQLKEKTDSYHNYISFRVGATLDEHIGHPSVNAEGVMVVSNGCHTSDIYGAFRNAVRQFEEDILGDVSVEKLYRHAVETALLDAGPETDPCNTARIATAVDARNGFAVLGIAYFKDPENRQGMEVRTQFVDLRNLDNGQGLAISTYDGSPDDPLRPPLDGDGEPVLLNLLNVDGSAESLLNVQDKRFHGCAGTCTFEPGLPEGSAGAVRTKDIPSGKYTWNFNPEAEKSAA
jgi:hypothetical protein